MKSYEAVEAQRRFLPYLPVYARIDGRSFSRFTRGMTRPYDAEMSRAMVETTKWLVAETDALIGYTQSDEISLCWYTAKPEAQIFFDGRVQKMCSILAAMTTARFLQLAQVVWPERCAGMPPVFDCRVFMLPTKEEGANAFLWRVNDAVKNSITMAARAFYSHNDLQNRGSSEMQEMLWQKGINWNDYPRFFKEGTFIQRRRRLRELTEDELLKIPPRYRPDGPIERMEVVELDMPAFSRVTNRVGVIFDGEESMVATS